MDGIRWNSMDNEMISPTVLVLVLLWIAASTSFISVYVTTRERSKDITWAEFLLCIICLPGLLINIVAIPIVITICRLWEWLDRPIKRQDD